MIHDKLQNHINTTQGLGFRGKLTALSVLLGQLKNEGVSREDIVLDDFIDLVDSFIVTNTPDPIRQTLRIELSAIIGELLNILDANVSENATQTTPTKSEVEVDEYLTMSPGESINLKPDDFPDMEIDLEWQREIEGGSDG